MAKITATELQNEGWRKEQFNAAADAAAFTTYLEAVVTQAGAWARAKLGASAYDGAEAASYALVCIEQAETFKCNAILFRRRASFIDSAAVRSSDTGAYLERRGYLADATTMDAQANAALAEAARELGVALPDEIAGTAFAVGHIETGAFPQTSEEALNYDG